MHRLHLPKLRGRKRSRGQGVVEFAIALPVLMLILLIVVDAGRLFFGSVTLHNATRIAASYAAAHPNAWGGAPDANQQAAYAAQIQRDSAALCNPPIPDPTFPDGAKTIGLRAQVTLTCDFRMITPIIGAVLGNIVKISATETFPIRDGLLASIPTFPPVGTPAPTATPAPTPTPGPTPTGTGGPTPTPTLPPGVCIVPTIMNQKINDVIDDWRTAGFDQTQLNVGVGPGNYRVGKESVGSVQSVWDGSQQQCATFQLNVGP
jgi:hypothetical protein